MFIVFVNGILFICVVESGSMLNVGSMVLIFLLICFVWVCVYVDECNFS